MARRLKSKPKAARILIVEDHPIVRERLAEIICREPDLLVCGEADNVDSALELVNATRPDLAIVDLTLRSSHGLNLIKKLKEKHPRLPALVLSMHDEVLHAERSLHAGARGYITKQEATRRILQAIRTVLRGDVYLSHAMTSRLATQFAERTRSSTGLAIDSLTDRELLVFELLGQGHATRQIAGRLEIDVRTVETYRARIKGKLHIKDGTELLQHAIRWMHDGGVR